MPSTSKYLRIKDAAQLLGVCDNTLRNWGRAGKISEHRHPVNNYRLYREADLKKLMRELDKSAAKPKPR